MKTTAKTRRIPCETCGDKFVPTRPWHKRCSGRCRKAAFDARMRERLRAAEIILRGAHGS